MPSIDRIRSTTLTLLSLAAGGLGRSPAEPSPPWIADEDEEAPRGADDPFAPGAPVFEAVEAALKDAGYLDS